MIELLVFTITYAQINSNSLPKLAIRSSISGVLQVVFASAALLSVIFIAFGGLKYTLSNGDPQGIARAKDTILYAVIGLVIAISAFGIVSFVGGRL